MKKVVLGGLFFALVGFTVYSCKKEIENKKNTVELLNKSSDEDLDIEKICYMHNSIIEKIKPQLISDESIYDMNDYISFMDKNLPLITKVANELDPQNNYLEINYSRFKQITSKAESIKTKSTTDDENVNFSEYMRFFLEDTYQNGLISEYLKNETIELANNAEIMTRSEIINYSLNNYANNISEEEVKYKKLIQEMIQSSNKVWKEKTDGSSVIIADGIGALYGMLLGPVGSVVYGTGFSLLENELAAQRKQRSQTYAK
jgi:hypothetical protein